MVPAAPLGGNGNGVGVLGPSHDASPLRGHVRHRDRAAGTTRSEPRGPSRPRYDGRTIPSHRRPEKRRPSPSYVWGNSAPVPAAHGPAIRARTAGRLLHVAEAGTASAEATHRAIT